MVTWCCTEPARLKKTNAIMQHFSRGWPDARVIEGMPPDDGQPFVIWGQLWTALQAIPLARAQNRPFWHVDNGYFLPANGSPEGYFRVTYRGLAPVLIDNPDFGRSVAAGKLLKPWRSSGRHILFALPAVTYGRCMGYDIHGWIERKIVDLKAATSRPIVIRAKTDPKPIWRDFRDCWAVVTHSSNASVDAILAGRPVFAEPTCPAAPVCNFNLTNLENPYMPEREFWLASLLSQQFTLDEMADGTAYRFLSVVQEKIDDRNL